MTGDFDIEFDIDQAVPWGRNRIEYLVFFDLLGLALGARSRHLQPLMQDLTARGYACEVRAVAYEFQKGGNEMLRIVRD